MSSDLIKTIPQYLIPQHLLTALLGCLANVKHESTKNALIRYFIRRFNVNMEEAIVEDPTAYPCFNDFFIRHLKPECRPLADATIVSPVDGSVSEIGAIHQGKIIQAKGIDYSVVELLDENAQFSQLFDNGCFTTLYLSPKDYHRIHMPCAGKLIKMKFLPGSLFSVQPSTVNVVPKLFARNERLVMHFETDIGPMALVMVGAVIVGAMGTSWHGDIQRSKKAQLFDYTDMEFAKGDKLGYFKLGSTVVLLFAHGDKMHWNNKFSTGSTIRFGEELAEINNTSEPQP
jgi:phosphatidylserine decarboxylase